MTSKRSATSDLNHDNWDHEEEPEERGEFRTASSDELKNRVIKKARRKITDTATPSTADADGSEKQKSVFSGFAGFGKQNAATTAGSTPFSFLSKIPTGNSNAAVSSSVSSSSQFMFAVGANNSEKPSEPPKFSFGGNAYSTSLADKKLNSQIMDKTTTSSTALKNNDDKSGEYFAKVKNLNEQVSVWIKSHVDSNPFCNLTPIFKDYEKHFKGIENEEQKSNGITSNTSLKADIGDAHNTIASSPGTQFGSFKFTTTTASDSTPAASFSKPTVPSSNTSNSKLPAISFGQPSAASSNTSPFKAVNFGFKDEATTSITSSEATAANSQKTNGFSFGLQSNEMPSKTTFSFGNPSSDDKKPTAAFSFTPGATPFSFGNIKPPAPAAPSSDNAEKDEDEEDSPPKVEFKQVVEADAIYSKKCKVFVKKEGNFSDRGVGTLYLKPVKDSEKTQLLVRADTNLGNILINLILNSAVPCKRMGKNNVILICNPTPDATKPTSILLRVKSGEEADQLHAIIEKYKK